MSMANNRLYLRDSTIGNQLLLAKGFGDGWDVRVTTEALQEFLSKRPADIAESHSGAGTSLVIVTEYSPPREKP